MVGRRHITFAAAASCLFASGCDSDSGQTTGAESATAMLRRAKSCGEAASEVRAELKLQFTEALDEQHAWVRARIEGDGHLCGGYGLAEDTAFEGATGARSTSSQSATDEGASDYTTTNNQVADVHEPDLVKNDDRFIYMVTGDELWVLKAWPANETNVLSKTAIVGQPTRLFLRGDEAIVYSEVGTQQCGYFDEERDPPRVRVTTFDLGDRSSAPVPVHATEIDGLMVGGRRINDTVHTAVFTSTPRPITPTFPIDDTWYDCDKEVTVAQVDAAFGALRKQGLDEINAMTEAEILPTITQVAYEGGSEGEKTTTTVSCDDLYLPTEGIESGYVTVTSFSVDAPANVGSSTVIAGFGDVYASEEAMYIANPRAEAVECEDSSTVGSSSGVSRTSLPSPGGWEFCGWRSHIWESHVDVHKFVLGEGNVAALPTGSGTVPGRIINQFAMDEHEGRLRIATTVDGSRTGGADSGVPMSNGVYVLEPVAAEGSLALIGSVTGLAETEDIRAVRFDGDRGYMVTFKKTDPLYTFDFDPSTGVPADEPGELKIPGFSTYMHFLGEEHEYLLTIGFEAEEGDDAGTFAWFQGVALQIFDVRESPAVLVHKEVIGTRGTSSDATNDHLAFTFYASKGLLAIPMGICEGDGTGSMYGSQMTFNGLLVYKVDPDSGFTALGGVNHGLPSLGERSTGAQADVRADYGCYNWWQNPNSDVKRSIFMSDDEGNDYVYSISPTTMKVTHLDREDTSTLGPVLADVTLGGVEEQPYWRCGWEMF